MGKKLDQTTRVSQKNITEGGPAKSGRSPILPDRPLLIVGIDEAGRGPLFGPLAIGAVVLLTPLSAGIFFGDQGIKDSKKLTEAKREAVFKKLRQFKKTGELNWAVELVPAKHINTHGLRPALDYGVANIIKKLKLNPEQHQLLFDGSLWGDKAFNQQTIIKGDEKVLEIALASVVAKVTRDTKIITLAKKYPHYGLEIHKGYGTKAHLEALEKYGPTAEHRQWGRLKL